MDYPKNDILYTRCWKEELKYEAPTLSGSGVWARTFFERKDDPRLRSMDGDITLEVRLEAFPPGEFKPTRLGDEMWSICATLWQGEWTICPDVEVDSSTK